jgi:hypothetical protein
MKKAWLVVMTLFALPAYGVDFEWQPFGSAYYAQAFNKDAQPLGFSPNQNPQFTPFSLVGLNLKTQLSSDWYTFVQLVGDGANLLYVQTPNFATFFQFGYLDYKPSEMFSFRMGRLGIPLWTAGENFRMAAQQPYRTKPPSIYNMTTFSALDGVSLTGKLFTDFGNVNLMIFGGLPVSDGAYPENYSARNMLGAKINFEGEGWKARIQVSRYTSYSIYSQTPWTNVGASSDFDANEGSYNSTVDYVSGEVGMTANTVDVTAGWTFDKWGLVSWTEVGYFRTPHPHSITPTQDAVAYYTLQAGTYYEAYAGGYTLIGYRFGDWLPRYQFARAISWDLQYPGAVSSHVIGLNYQFNKHIVIKAEYELDIFPAGNQFADNGVNYFSNLGSGQNPTRASAIYAGCDFVY